VEPEGAVLGMKHALPHCLRWLFTCPRLSGLLTRVLGIVVLWALHLLGGLT
jgi:hypothetical protein